ncbi:hypothetical protein [Hoyosella altamirensis]|uniref:Uncharacterized protein n=1 Tax=Hoyosella altamirensis TaxID=616997 RepID=A0A839RNE7_9ACTN|nr:hypothetical protein [Hoyosella altamirensis]MBB3037586.1 hypothetical protein [Hoyosella altamirensis]
METKAQRLARIEKAMVLSGIAGVGVFALAGCWTDGVKEETIDQNFGG